MAGVGWLRRVSLSELGAALARGDAHAQRIELDEAASVGLIVGAAVFLEGRDIGIEQRSSDLRPTTMTLPLYSFRRTTPFTLTWEASIICCSMLRSGLHQ